MDEQYKKKRLQYCISMNCIVFVLLTLIIIFFADKNTYLQFGPNDSLNILGFKINTWKHYFTFQFVIAFITSTDVLINEIVSPVLGFNIYNPDKKIIVEFKKNELQFYANLHWLINSLRDSLIIIISVSQIDCALLRVLYGQITSWYTIRMLLNEKTFPNDNNYEEINEIEMIV